MLLAVLLSMIRCFDAEFQYASVFVLPLLPTRQPHTWAYELVAKHRASVHPDYRSSGALVLASIMSQAIFALTSGGARRAKTTVNCMVLV